MEYPRVKKFYQVYRLESSNEIYIGLGPEKYAIDDATFEMETFLSKLNGTVSIGLLRQEFPETDKWLESLESMGIIEDACPAKVYDDELVTRYSRQINYFRLYENNNGISGVDVQKQLKKSRVVVAGTGAGGTTLLRFLNAAGIGTLEAIDFDTFEISNLPTHSTLDEDDIGQHKIDVLERHLKKQNSQVNFIGHKHKITSESDLAKLITGADFFCTAFDRPRIKAAIWSNLASLMTKVPNGSIGVTDKGARAGAIVIPQKTACLSCIGIHDQSFIKSSEEGALMGTTVGMLASIMVHDIIKVITGYATPRLVGRSLYINTDALTFQFIEHDINPDCVCQKYRNEKTISSMVSDSV